MLEVPPPIQREDSAPLGRALASAPSWTLTRRQLCDLELVLDGSFAPLTGFLGAADYDAVLGDSRRADGALWPMPVLLDVADETAAKVAPGEPLVLRDGQGTALAVLWSDERFALDPEREARAVYGTTDRRHPGVAYLFERTHPTALGGRLEGLTRPEHQDFVALRLDPGAVRAEIARRGWRRVVGFQTRNPLHRAHFEMTRRAMADLDAGLLLHPAIGATRPGDLEAVARVRAYRALLPRYPPGSALLALLPLAMRMAGPREALWHALIRRNYGCTHFIVGRDHAGPGNDAAGRPFYPPLAARELVARHQEEIGLTVVPYGEFVYAPERAGYVEASALGPGEPQAALSGTELRARLDRGAALPEWFTFPEVEAELRRAVRPRRERGFVVFMTGLSAAGKSTLAEALRARLEEFDARAVSVLDGDEFRRLLSSELGFSREHRELNVRRIGYVAAAVARAGGVAICAPIAPYEESRRAARLMAEEAGALFLLVHVATTLEVCERRDRKGLYARARAGSLAAFTGISDPYEVPVADVTVDAGRTSPRAGAEAILLALVEAGAVDPASISPG